MHEPTKLPLIANDLITIKRMIGMRQWNRQEHMSLWNNGNKNYHSTKICQIAVNLKI